MCTNARESDFLRYEGKVNTEGLISGGGRFEVSSAKTGWAVHVSSYPIPLVLRS
jgi:hypothetical protein